jgi:citrate lyase subunit beta / citryl-CoA lyase
VSITNGTPRLMSSLASEDEPGVRAPSGPSAYGVLAAQEIALVPGVRHLSLGGVDLRRDIGAGDGSLQTLYARSHLVVASVAAGLESPIDSVYARLDDDQGLREHAEFARSLGFLRKSAVHPRQANIINDAFTPSPEQLAWARTVLDAFEAAGGQAVKLPNGEFVDLPVADRARRVLETGRPSASGGAQQARPATHSRVDVTPAVSPSARSCPRLPI